MAKLKSNLLAKLRGPTRNVSRKELNWWMPAALRDKAERSAAKPTARPKTLLGGDGEALGG